MARFAPFTVLKTVVLAACILAGSLRAGESDGPAGRNVVIKAAQAVFQAGNYKQLEQTADDLRRTKARLPEGVWKLPCFYAGLGPARADGDTLDWKGCFEKLDAWREEFPNSLTEPVARASALVSYGWEARGSGYASTVTPEGWQLLAERLKQARGVLEAAAKLPARDPHWFFVMQQVALGQGWGPEESDALYKEAVAAEPTYYDYYFARATAELPRWGGGPDAWIDFAEDAAQKDDPQEGLSVYTRIVWAHQGFAGGGFQNPKFDWKKFRQGFRDIEKHFPDSEWNLNNFCRFACLLGDRETARELFDRLGESPNLAVWENHRAFDDWRQWARSDQPPAELRANLTVPNDERLEVNSLAFSPDGQTLLAGYDDGAVRLWDLAARKVAWRGDFEQGEVAAVAFSPDGKIFAAGTGSQPNREPGEVRLWDAATHRQVTTLRRAGNIFGLAFTADAKRLAITGGIYGGKGGKSHGEGAFYDVAAQRLDPLSWADDGYVLSGVALSPDGQFLVTPKGNSMNCWSLAQQEFVTDFHTRIVHGNTVRAVAISPDGRTLVTGVAPGWTDRTGPGELRRWDMGAPGWPEIKTPAWAAPPGGVLVLAFSPDGKLLATGGYDGGVRLWNTATGQIAATLLGHQQIVASLAFSPDGKTVASGALDGTIKWWNVPAAPGP